jgi:hypothetical protein
LIGQKGQLDSYNKIFNAQLTPISSISGEGLSELVINLFHVMPQKVAPAKLQESLLFTKRLNRFAFTINESSNLLAEIILLKGNQANEIRAGYLWLFALICKHYSVDEDTWKKCNGDAFQISTEAKEAGVKTYKRVRHPQDFWEMIRAFFGHKFEQDVVEHERIGIKGLKQLLPGVYRLLYDLADVSGSRLSEEIIHQIVEAQAHKLEPLIEQNKLTELETVPPINHSSEQALRWSVVFCKVTHGFCSDWGAELFAQVRSLVNTARHQSISAFQAISHALASHQSDWLLS